MTETIILCAADDVVEGEIKQAPLPDGSNVALYRVDGAIYATATGTVVFKMRANARTYVSVHPAEAAE